MEDVPLYPGDTRKIDKPLGIWREEHHQEWNLWADPDIHTIYRTDGLQPTRIHSLVRDVKTRTRSSKRPWYLQGHLEVTIDNLPTGLVPASPHYNRIDPEGMYTVQISSTP